jgi:hypothetical protein
VSELEESTKIERNRHFRKKMVHKSKKKAQRVTAKPSGKGFFELLRKPLGSHSLFSRLQARVLDETDINDVETFTCFDGT